MDVVMECTEDKTVISSLRRFRGALNSIFISYLVTEDCKKLEHFIFDPGGGHFESRYDFPYEQPTSEH